MTCEITLETVTNTLRLWLPIILSFLSLVLSLFNLWKSRKTLDVEFEEEYRVPSAFYKNQSSYREKKKLPIDSDKQIIIFVIKVVNPSPIDIAFFDIEVMDSSNKIIKSIYKHNLGYKDNDDDFQRVKVNAELRRVNLLDSDYGIFKANSFKKIELAAIVPKSCDKVTITFNVAKKSLKHNRYSSVRKNYRHYTKTYDLSDIMTPKNQNSIIESNNNTNTVD